MCAASPQKLQSLAAAFARTFLAHSLRKTFISARNVAMRGPTPLYFFVIPVTVCHPIFKTDYAAAIYRKRLTIDQILL